MSCLTRMEESWKKVLTLIKNEISSANFRTWFSQTKLSGILGQTVTIDVSSAFVKDQLLSRYQMILERSIFEVFGNTFKIEFKIDPSLADKKAQPQAEEEDLFHVSSHKPTSTVSLNPKYSLDSFVVGLTNNLAYAAAQAVVQNPGSSYNPLFIYGPSGVGKTHLMQGIGNALMKKNPYIKLVFASSERFMVDFVDSIQTKSTGGFRQKYRSPDVILIDDIQFIAGKDSTQEEFFHTFNELHSKNSQIVLTSDRTPSEMQKLESRLLSRFQGGLMVDIQMPDFDTRIAILKAKLQEKGENSLPDEVLAMIAESAESNTRELEGKLIQVLQLSKLKGQTLSHEDIVKILGNKTTAKSSTMDPKKVLNQINQYFSIKMADIIGPRRQKELVLPRQIAMFLMYEECKIPMEKVGIVLGGRDHTTILHGIEKIRQAINRDREIQRIVIEIKQQLAG